MSIIQEEKISADALWERLLKHQGAVFYTAKGLPFTYQIKGGEIFVDRKEKSITKSSVEMAYEKAAALGFLVKGPKKLQIFGASYVYAIFLGLELIQKES